jgi:heterodisulfide reductase subunit A-like polyferredoxin/coenzyme F420-reducing hydrogenase delta subunit
MKVGGFFCTCAKTSNINYKEVGKALKSNFRIFVVQDLLCTGEGQAHIVDYARRGLIDAALIGCTEKNKIFDELGEKLELSFYYINLREHCGWVHGEKEATEKGRSMIAAKIVEIEAHGELLPHTLDVGSDVLFVGNSPEVLEVAHALSGVADVKVLAEDLTKASIHGSDVELALGRVKDVNGEIGNFTVLVEPNPISFEKCISCGKCSDVCPKGAISHKHYSVSKECDGCRRCIEACPVDAISFGKGTQEIKAGQIVVANSAVRGKIGIYPAAGDGASLQAAVLKAVMNLGRIVKPLAIEADLRNCAAGKSRIVGCTLCESACPHGAIVRTGDKISYSHGSCEGCGACATVCPVSIPTYKLKPREVIHGQMKALLQGNFKKKVLLFTCEKMEGLLASLGGGRRGYYPVLPLFVPCLNALSELEILRAFDLGAEGVILLGCGQCPHGAVYKSAVDFSGTVLEAFNLGKRPLILQSTEPEIFVTRVEEFVSSLRESRIKGNADEFSFKNKGEGILELFRRFSSYMDTVPDKTLEGDAPFGLLDVDNSKCTLCNTCSVMCPQEALQKNGGMLTFTHGLCIACGLCEKSCPEKAITLRRAVDFKKLLEDKGEVVCRGDVFTCPSCGKATISKNALQATIMRLGKNSRLDMELLKFCPDCRGLKVLGFVGGEDDK